MAIELLEIRLAEKREQSTALLQKGKLRVPRLMLTGKIKPPT